MLLSSCLIFDLQQWRLVNFLVFKASVVKGNLVCYGTIDSRRSESKQELPALSHRTVWVGRDL